MAQAGTTPSLQLTVLDAGQAGTAPSQHLTGSDAIQAGTTQSTQLTVSDAVRQSISRQQAALRCAQPSTTDPQARVCTYWYLRAYLCLDNDHLAVVQRGDARRSERVYDLAQLQLFPGGGVRRDVRVHLAEH